MTVTEDCLTDELLKLKVLNLNRVMFMPISVSIEEICYDVCCCLKQHCSWRNKTNRLTVQILDDWLNGLALIALDKFSMTIVDGGCACLV